MENIDCLEGGTVSFAILFHMWPSHSLSLPQPKNPLSQIMNWEDIFKPKDGSNPQKSIPNGPCIALLSFSLTNHPDGRYISATVETPQSFSLARSTAACGSIPAVQKVLSVTKDAGVVLAGVGRDLNSSLQKLGGKNISKRIGRGVGISGGGLFPKPGIVHRVRSYFLQSMLKMMMKHGVIPAVTAPLQRGITTIASMTDVNVQSIAGSAAKSGLETAKITALDLISSGISPLESAGESVAVKDALEGVTASRVKKVVADSLQNNPASQHKEEKEGDGKLVSKHEETIAKLTEENKKLCKLLEEKDQNKTKICPHNDCLECRRRQRKTEGRAS
ncbi:hypothetical protein ACLOJK_030502 [Asimina triloba]